MQLQDLIVLVVEDDTNVKMTIKYMLEEMGVKEVITFESTINTLKYLDENINKIDIILCDWNMPQKTGLELLREIRQIKPDMPFVMVTARADKESVMLAKAENITSYVSKPITFNGLQTKIKVIMEKANNFKVA